MSYSKQIENVTIRFEDEKSYLNCRLDYLAYRQICEDNYYGEGSADSLTFLGYIENEMYDMEKCVIEGIESNPFTEYNSYNEQVYVYGIDYGVNYSTDTNTSNASNYAISSSGSNDYTFTEHGNNMVFFGDIQDKTNQKNLNSKNNKESIKSRFDILDL